MSDRGQGNTPGPNQPWYLQRPDSDERTSMARSQPSPPGPHPPRTPPPAYRQPPSSQDIPWYLQRPHRPAPAPDDQKPTARAKDSSIVPWSLVAAGGIALLAGVAVVAVNIPKLATSGGAVLDVNKVEAGVLQTLSDPASGYGANSVTDVSCNNGRNPSADKGTAFMCDATVNGAQRHVAVVVADDKGTYEVDGPR